jgi:hypothetical protein
MKFNNILVITGLLLTVMILGCSKDDSPTSSGQRVFSGITQRNEFGDTLQVDPTDWVVVGLGNTAHSRVPVTVPIFRNLQQTAGQTEISTVSIGAFPNPFIPGAGHLMINLALPDPLQVQLYVVNGSGSDSIFLANLLLPPGDHTFPWDGTNGSGNRVTDDIYRVYFTSGLTHSFGDVQTTLSQPADPQPNAPYIGYAASFYDSSDYYAWEWGVATAFGPSGQLGGLNRFSGPLPAWQGMDYLNRFLYLPMFVNYDLRTASPYQCYYLLANKHFQFGAGWPVAGNYGSADSTRPEWQLSNIYHDDYQVSFPGSP